MKIKPYIEYRGAVDEYANDQASGIYIAGFCLIGWQHFRLSDRGWIYGPIIFNISFGLWRDKDDEE